MGKGIVAIGVLALVAVTWAACEDEGGGVVEDGDGAIGQTDTGGQDTLAIPDDGGGSDGTEPDVEEVHVPQEGEFGYPCANNAECNSGFCVPTAQGSLCTRTCSESCPDGWTCRPNNQGDPVFVCMPRWIHLCGPCERSSECTQNATDLGHYCLDRGDEGSFCGGACASDGRCPKGYSCEDVAVGDGVEKQCVPDDGTCSCSPLAIQLERETPCAVTNEFGSCPGTRMCTKDGLSDCDAKTPEAEVCNGLDDDCDGQIDEGDSFECEVTNEHGTCEGTATCKGGEEVCDAPEAKPEVCNGLDDDCDGLIDENLCDDDNPCTDDKCQSDGTCVHSNNTADCDDGNACTQTDKCSGGVCEGFNPRNCDDGNPCTVGTCDPAVGCTYANDNEATCDLDGSICTEDYCQNGECKSGTQKDCDDGNPCTNDQCDPLKGKCVHTPKDESRFTVPSDPAFQPCKQGSAGVCQVWACNGLSGACEARDKPDGAGCGVDEACPPCAGLFDCAFCEPEVPHTCQGGTCEPDFSSVTCGTTSCDGGCNGICLPVCGIGVCLPLE